MTNYRDRLEAGEFAPPEDPAAKRRSKSETPQPDPEPPPDDDDGEENE